MEPFVKILSKYSYSSSRQCGAFLDFVSVDVVDTSVDNAKNNISVNSSSPAKSFYTNSDTPVSLFGPGITATHYDPNRHRGLFGQKSAQQPAAAAAVSPSSPSAANAASNASSSQAAASNSATVNQ